MFHKFPFSYFRIILQAYQLLLNTTQYYLISRDTIYVVGRFWRFRKQLNFVSFESFHKFSFSDFEHHFSSISTFRDVTSILFDIEQLTFMCSIDFESLKFSIFVIFHHFCVSVLCFFNLLFIPEHFCFNASFPTSLYLRKNYECQAYFRTSLFDPKKCKRLSH